MLALSHISKTFQQQPVAHNISLTVPNGTITAILGSSGSGKSTLLKMIAGLIPPDNGTIHLNNRPLTSLPPEQRHIAMMFQNFALFPHLNVWQNVAFSLTIKKIPQHIARSKAEQTLKEVGLPHYSERSIHNLSGGEQQRVALARALLSQPEALLLDEPFSSLDTQLKNQLQQQVRQLIQEKNIATLLVSHDPLEACSISDHIILLHQGKIIQHGSPTELFTHPTSKEAIHLLGGINTSETHYVPPTAITLAQTGEQVQLLSCKHYPSFFQIEINHPVWHNLIFFHHQAIIDPSPTIQIDLQKIVYF